MTKVTTYGLDVLRTTEDEAVELAVHHISLAFVYFHNAPNGARIAEEIDRLITVERGVGYEGPVRAAMKAFFSTLTLIYEDDE